MKIRFPTLALILLVFCGAAGPAGPQLPRFDPNKSCAALGSALNPLPAKACLKHEQDAYDYLRDYWSTFAPAIRTYCTRMGALTEGPEKYSLVEKCILLRQPAESLKSQAPFHY